MPSSQLKTLKQSLREQGLVGQQSSRKRKRQPINGTSETTRTQQHGALQRIRDQYNPFDIKPTATGKFGPVISNEAPDRKSVHRPGVTKGRGEANVSLPIIFLISLSDSEIRGAKLWRSICKDVEKLAES